jgi:hypothetical protein
VYCLLLPAAAEAVPVAALLTSLTPCSGWAQKKKEKHQITA